MMFVDGADKGTGGQFFQLMVKERQQVIFCEFDKVAMKMRNDYKLFCLNIF
jgi:hypothetical protein